jgi:hypothetical protein
MHEIVTLQFGQQANYLGTHYWNSQESYFTYAGQEESPVDHDISFRAGIGADGQDTYTPRTLIYDLKGAFGTLRRENALYELQQQEQGAQHQGWSGVTIPLQLPPIAPSRYQQALEQGHELPGLTTETVRFWSDYNHLFYHPKSIVQLNEYELSSSLLPFERWSSGEELFEGLDREVGLLDRDLRPFLEECDQLQGIQVLAGVDDAWGGFAAKYLERIADEVGKGCRWVFGLSEGRRGGSGEQMLRVANAARSMVAVDGTASLQIPLSSHPAHLPEYVTLDSSSRWHTSALQAAVMESLTLPTRLRQSSTACAAFDMLETTLSNEGNRRIAAAGLSVDDKHTEDPADTRMANGHANGVHHDEDGPAKVDINFLPEFTTSGARPSEGRSHIFSAAELLRGYWKDEEDIADANAEVRDRWAAAASGPRISTHQTSLLFPVLSSYPEIFCFTGRPKVSPVCILQATQC